MPHPEIERLDKGSDDAQIQAAISACIATEMHNQGERSPEQIQAMCYGMARDKTGKQLGQKE